jgi:polyribonucleotide nucleotidyltransferase
LVTIEGEDEKTVAEARRRIAQAVPSLHVALWVPQDRIALVIGRGGATRKAIEDKTGALIDVGERQETESLSDPTSYREVTVWAKSDTALHAAVAEIKRIAPGTL